MNRPANPPPHGPPASRHAQRPASPSAHAAHPAKLQAGPLPPHTVPPHASHLRPPPNHAGAQAAPGWPHPAHGGYYAAPPPFTESAYPWPDEVRDERSRFARRLLNTLAVFVVGAGVGLAVAWWAGRPAPDVTQDRPPTAAQVAPQPEQRKNAPGLPLASDELPYDGVATGDDAPLVPRLPYAIESVTGASGAPGASGDAGDAADSAAGSEEGTVAATAGSNASRKMASEAGTGKAAAEDVKGAPKVAREDEKEDETGGSSKETVASAKSAEPEKKLAAAEKAATSPSAATRSPRAAAARAPARQDGEIDRIRQQAADELRRRTVRERALEYSRSLSNPASATGSPNDRRSPGATPAGVRGAAPQGHRTGRVAEMTRTRLAQCGDAPSLLARERCRWKVCGGRWGQDGCPDYQQTQNSANLFY